MSPSIISMAFAFPNSVHSSANGHKSNIYSDTQPKVAADRRFLGTQSTPGIIWQLGIDGRKNIYRFVSNFPPSTTIGIF